MGEALIHYELRQFQGDYDLCQVNDTGTVVRVSVEIHDLDILERIADAFDATILPEGNRGTLPA